MKANELQINNFLQAPNVQFVIPVYQRNYDWTNTECKELLNVSLPRTPYHPIPQFYPLGSFRRFPERR
jgi:hypothetical protein